MPCDSSATANKKKKKKTVKFGFGLRSGCVQKKMVLRKIS